MEKEVFYPIYYIYFIINPMKEPDNFLKFGYRAGIVLAFVGIIASAAYLFVFISTSPDASSFTSEFKLIGLSMDMRLRFLSTAIFVGMSFGFLGFALFLIQAQGEVDVDAEIKDYKIKIAKLSPGLFVILCATTIIIVCATFRVNYSLNGASEPEKITPTEEIHSNYGENGENGL
jgi:hypothetical protein